MKFICVVTILCGLVILTEGLICWTCENARSNAMCKATGRLKTCDFNQQACQTHIRTDPQGMRITKECKQAHACNNNYIQNPRAAWVPSQCNLNVQGSVCRCCCDFDRCSYNTLLCPQVPTTTTVALTPPPTTTTPEASGAADLPTCPEVEIRSGSATCTRGNNVGSTCTFSCQDGLSLHPANFSHSECDGTAWNEPIPCCTRPCPPFARADAVLILDSSSSVRKPNWDRMIEFVVSMLTQFVVNESSLRVGAFRYNRAVDSDTQILLNGFTNDKTGLVQAIQDIPYRGSGTRTGNAIRHAKDVLLLPENGNRPNVTDLVFVVTDGRSQDAVAEVARELRATGAVTFVIAVIIQGSTIERDQMLDIAGSPDRLFEVTGGFDDLDSVFADRLRNYFCPPPCENF
uniref:collagen alpha-1(XII) chain-like n=1 Tax=Ciona intestinalis TaxID=7719 RepID=UPI000180C3D0|nr:collagen alpha-1(XII) chain-like [Ciona intestinalis]|eukprot:XP_002124410.1 collagen alpha-1(XII) chain-like [Ciona intestinalis]